MGKSEALTVLQERFDAMFIGFDKKCVATKKNKVPTQLEYYIISEFDKDGISPHIVIQENNLYIYLRYPLKNLLYSGKILSDISIMNIIQSNFENLELLLVRRDLKRCEHKLIILNGDLSIIEEEKIIEVASLKFDINELKRLIKLYK